MVAISALDRKLLRDLYLIRGQAIAIALVLACGVGTFVGSLSLYGSLEYTQTTFYDRYRFADVFARIKRAPLALADRVADVPGVARVQPRVVVGVTLDVPGLTEPAVGRIISIPERYVPGLNDLHVSRGRWVEPGQRGEVLVNDAFAEEHKLKPGAVVDAVINGRRQQLRVVGVALSPEYVFPIREGELLPDNKRFGIFWMGREELAPAYDMEGAFNDLTLSLSPGATEGEVIRLVDRLIEPYGGTGAFGRAEQISNKFISNEIAQLKSMALVAPSIFLGVAAFLLNVAVTRLVGAQREQIAALKAFGYTPWEIAGHYLKLVGVLVLAGLAVGTGLGAAMGYAMTQMYTMFFRFPVFAYQLEPSVVVLALGVSGGAALAGTFGAIRRAARQPPAEAMRPEPPASYRPTVIERLLPDAWLSPATRMILRNLGRRPMRSLLTVLGIALAVSVLVMGNFIEDAIDVVMDVQFFSAQRQDVTVTFVEPAPSRVLSALRHLPGVRQVEPFRSVAARISHGHHSRRMGVMARPPDAELSRVMDADRGPVEPPPEGLLISEKLAEVLAVTPGESVTVEVLEGERPVRTVPVVGTYRDFTDPSATMSLAALHRLLREGDTYSGAFLSVDRSRLEDLYAELKQAPRVAGVAIQEAAIKSFEDTLAQNLLVIKSINLVFACVIAVGVVYNSARIALAERTRDLATLRVLGFTRREISAILLGELAVLTLAAIPLGLAIGTAMVHGAAVGMDTELQRMPPTIFPRTYAFAVVGILGAAIASGLWVRRGLDRLDLVAVLKARE